MVNRLLQIAVVLCMVISTIASNFYDVLGIPADADEGAIKKAYRKLSLKYHPGKYLKSEIFSQMLLTWP